MVSSRRLPQILVMSLLLGAVAMRAMVQARWLKIGQ